MRDRDAIEARVQILKILHDKSIEENELSREDRAFIRGIVAGMEDAAGKENKHIEYLLAATLQLCKRDIEKEV